MQYIKAKAGLRLKGLRPAFLFLTNPLRNYNFLIYLLPSFTLIYKNNRILFVHGTGDAAVSFRGTEEMYKDCRGEKKLILLKRRLHSLVLEKDCETYLEDIIGWVKEH